ncbi:MAG: ABC transporter ATP-binding protein [Fimbriimonadaceae bacterium]|nr:ABC transporter ATP-binding protein [Fimbriimonadaceae bacterium]
MLEVKDAVVTFPNGLRAVDGVSFNVQPGETVALVGESGCGKTTVARAILGLQPLSEGSIIMNGEPVSRVTAGLAKRVGMVWQDPYASLDSRWTIGRIVSEPAQMLGETINVGELLTSAGLDPSYANRYPHQMSGGQRQRVAIARALALRPPLVICDEPTAALDLSVQAQILNLLQDLKENLGSAFLYISHDLGTVHYLADRVMVMKSGQIVESGSSASVFENPQHPYTQRLLAAVPRIDRLGVIPGSATNTEEEESPAHT